ncbi:MAG: hypothetical protein EOO28_13620 [Comamonadaceae bacterium]|nr:MAG: hypothetical protein EOO28_13620 [Comamonadaceae bacterium]
MPAIANPASAHGPSPAAATHLLIPFAACAGDGWTWAMQQLPPASLKNLGKLLSGMALVDADRGDAMSLSPPHERVLARTTGLADKPVDGLIAWAALQASTLNGLEGAASKAWGLVTPCHWAMGREHATMADPAALDLPEAESRTLLAAMQPYFETDGITLHYVSPTAWLAEGELLRSMPTASLDRVLGRNVDPWLPDVTSAPVFRRLQNEMQMLLYTHPLNDERGAKRQWPVNSFWISGTGALDKLPPAATTQPQLQLQRSLKTAALADDWQAYSEAWAALDADEIAGLLDARRAGKTVRLTLAGERNAHTYESVKSGLGSRLAGLFKSTQPMSVLEQL